MHQAPGASCGILYYSGLVSCPFYAIPIIIIPFLIYKNLDLFINNWLLLVIDRLRMRNLEGEHENWSGQNHTGQTACYGHELLI